MRRRFASSVACAVAIPIAAAASAADRPPAVEEILARHVEALGGAQLRDLRSLKVTGTFSFNGIDSPYVVYRQRPDRFRFEAETERGTIVSAFDGETVWSQRPASSGAQQVEVIEGEDRQRFLDDNVDFDGPLVDCEKKGHEVELVGETDLDGVAAYHLELTLASGNQQQWFLSKDDHQAIRKTTTVVHRRAGPYERVWYLMEHRETGGISLPRYIEREDRQHVRAYTVDEVEVGIEIDQQLFAMPDPAPAEAE